MGLCLGNKNQLQFGFKYIWWNFINSMKIWPNDDISLLWLKLITSMEMDHFSEMKGLNLSVWWKLIKLVKIYYFDENLSLQWKYINLIQIHHFDENSSIWWKVTSLTIHHFGENSSLCWKIANMMKFHHFDEYSSLALKCKLIEFITLIKKNYNFDEDS